MRYLTFLLPVIFFITACSGGDSGNQQQAPQTENTAQAQDNQSDDIRTINIIGIDKMRYVVEEQGNMLGTAETIETAQDDRYILLNSIDAKAGEKIKIRLVTKSKLPAQAMSHNWVLLNMNTDLDAFTKAAQKAKDNEYIPSDMTDQIIAHTDMAAGSETVEVTFTVPEETGDYPYLCSFPAHFTAGMKGTLNVK